MSPTERKIAPYVAAAETAFIVGTWAYLIAYAAGWVH
jgi:hypothetical protein